MDKPNIVMIMTDQQGCHMLGCYGNRAIKTPNIDKLAKNGIMMTNNYIQNPVCMPSRASIFAGRYPSACGMTTNGTPMQENEITLPNALAMGGYHTAAFGKLHFRNECVSLDPGDGTQCEHEGIRPYYGFQEYKISNGNFYGPYLRWIEREYPQYYDDVIGKRKKLLGNTTDCWIKEIPVEIHQTYWVGTESVEFINKEHKKPFFLFSSFLDPHHPFDPPKDYATIYDEVRLPPRNVSAGDMDALPEAIKENVKKSKYSSYTEEDWDIVRKMAYAEVTLIDDTVGRIVNALEERGLLDNTIIIFTSDHGEMLGEHSLLYKGDFHYNELVRTPLIWYCPERWKNEKVLDVLSQSMDIMPTLLDIAGLPIPAPVQGNSILPLLEGDTEKGRDWVLIEHSEANTLVTDDWKITVRKDGDTGFLFNRKEDPSENDNLWHNADFSSIRFSLMQKMISCMFEARDQNWRQEGYW
jgi:arylsulfatase